MQKNKPKKTGQDKTPLWKLLGLKSDFKHAEIDNAYAKIYSKRKNYKKTRLAWKILRDPYFGSAYRYLRSTKKIFEAGFFDDGKNIDQPKKNNYNETLLTPINKIYKQLKKTIFSPQKKICSSSHYRCFFSPT